MPLLSAAKKWTAFSLQEKSLVTKLSKCYSYFAINIYQSLAHEENLIFSPFSIAVVLAMTAAGAGGNTLTQIKDVLNLYKFTDEKKINKAFSCVLSSISSNSQYKLLTANKIYVQNDIAVQEVFQNILADSYYTSAENVDFMTNADGVASKINSWVKKETNNIFKNSFPEGSLDSTTKLLLVNAIYFKGTWKKAFNENWTKPEDFTLTNGLKVSVPIMNKTKKLKYANSDTLNSKMLQLDYTGDRLVMYFILPHANDGLSELQQQLTPDAFDSFKKQLSIHKVIVQIPKFKLNFQAGLNKLLEGLGITDLFDPVAANLTRISDPKNENLYVSSVAHQAFVEVDEKGTTAAAVTSVGFLCCLSASVEPEIKTFVANHPFIFAIYDTFTDLILFMGNVYNPET